MSEDDSSLSVKKNLGGNPNFISHEPTEKTIATARAMASVGVQTKFIAAALEISEPTLIKYYKDEMNNARGKAHMQVGNSLFQKAIAGDTPSAIFYAKTQMGWKEPPKQINLNPPGDDLEDETEANIKQRIEKLIK